MAVPEQAVYSDSWPSPFWSRGLNQSDEGLGLRDDLVLQGIVFGSCYGLALSTGSSECF